MKQTQHFHVLQKQKQPGAQCIGISCRVIYFTSREHCLRCGAVQQNFKMFLSIHQSLLENILEGNP